MLKTNTPRHDEDDATRRKIHRSNPTVRPSRAVKPERHLVALVVFACSVQTRQGHLLSAKCTPFGTHTARGHTGANGINRRGQRNIFYKSTKCLRLSKSAATCSNRVAAATRRLVIYSFYIEHTFCRRNCQLLQTPVSVAVPNFVGSAELRPQNAHY